MQLSLRVRVVFGLAVVYLMIAKPDSAAAAIVIGLASILAIVLGVSRRQVQSTLAAIES